MPQAPVPQQDDLNVKDILDCCWRMKWWMLASAVLALIIAFCYVRSQTPTYQRSTWIMLNKPDGTNADLSLLAEFTGKTVTKKIDNEVFILKSPTLMSKVVTDLDLNTRYYHYVMPIADRLRFGRSVLATKLVEYYLNNPVEMSVEQNELYPDAMHPTSIYVKFKNIDGESFSIKKFLVNGQAFKTDSKTYTYGDSIAMDAFNLIISKTTIDDLIDGDSYICTWNTPMSTANAFESKLSATTNGKGVTLTDVVTLSFVDALPKRAEDILNALVLKTNAESREYKGLSMQSTMDFIDQRLAAISSDLGAAEQNYKNYQANRVVVNLESQSQLELTSDMQYKNQLTEVKMQIQILNMVSGIINESGTGDYRVIPANIGISDNGLNAIIANYNTLVAERNKMVANSSETNPRVLSMNSQLDDAKQSIKMSIASLQKVYALREKELGRVVGASQRKMADIPQQQYELQQLSRKVDIIEPLYLLLQQKREEAQIALCSQTDNFRVIEAAFGSKYPVSPNSKMIYMLALLIGLALPVGYVWARNFLKHKVETKKDIENKVYASVLAVLPKHPIEGGYSLLEAGGRDTSTEAFRMLRSNIQYLPGVRVIQVTSSGPGEGKSYVAGNLAASIAHTGKKVVIVGMDIRKPTLHKIFTKVQQRPSASVVGYLVGKVTSVDDMIQPSDIGFNLDVIVAGAVPPNPSELLSQGTLESLINELRQRYDYVIIDSAPYLPVTDSALINPYVDATLYVVRADYTELKMLDEINAAFTNPNQPVKNPYIVLNGLDLESSKYKYGYGYGYGKKGYGYGYGYGYGEDALKEDTDN